MKNVCNCSCYLISKEGQTGCFILFCTEQECKASCRCSCGWPSARQQYVNKLIVSNMTLKLSILLGLTLVLWLHLALANSNNSSKTTKQFESILRDPYPTDILPFLVCFCLFFYNAQQYLRLSKCPPRSLDDLKHCKLCLFV